MNDPTPSRSSVRPSRRRVLGGGTALGAALLAAPMTAPSALAEGRGKKKRRTPGAEAGVRYGTYDHPFAKDSLWNSVPLSPRLGDYRIPDTDTGWYPQVDDGPYSIGVYQAAAGDPAQQILPWEGEPGVWDPDAEEQLASVTLPHFPASTLPPEGTDGSVAIHDATTGRIWSFWQLRHREDGTWRAKQVSWAWQDGSGWGDPAHYFQGASASGSPNGAGLIRRAEYQDVDAPMYYHALTMTLDFSALLPGHAIDGSADNWTGAYVWPATAGDGWGAPNTGKIPEGSRMFLPAEFPVAELPSRELRKLARTLQTYGAYITDRNWRTPFTIGVQLGIDYETGDVPYSSWEEYEASGVPQSLDRMRKQLAVMTSCDGYLTAGGSVLEPEPGWGEDLLSMRGPWTLVSGPSLGVFDSPDQRLEFPTGGVTQRRTGPFEHVDWARLQAGERVRLRAEAGGGAALRLQICRRGRSVVDTGMLTHGRRVTFTWPAGDLEITWSARSGRSGGWVDGELRRV